MIKILLVKDLRLFFHSPMAFFIISSYWLLSGFFFSFNTIFVSAVDMVTGFHNMCILLLWPVIVITGHSVNRE